MSAFVRDRPVFLKTYGRQKRKLDQWLSPDLRKKAFSFSSTSSSDQSILETKFPMKPKKSRAAAAAGSRTTKRAKAAFKEPESDEENISANAPAASRNKVGSKSLKKAAVTKKPTGVLNPRSKRNKETTPHFMRVRKKRRNALSTSEEEDDSFMIKKKLSNVLGSSLSDKEDSRKRTRVSTAAPPLGKFVTRRKRALPVQSERLIPQKSFRVPNSTLNSSDDFVQALPSLPSCVTRRKRHGAPENVRRQISDPKCSAEGSGQALSSTVLREMSLNGFKEKRISCKRPLLCSTPSLVSKRNLPSLELSSFSCDELDRPPVKTTDSTFSPSQLLIEARTFSDPQSSQPCSNRTRDEGAEAGEQVEYAESAHQRPAKKLDVCEERTEDGGEVEEESRMSASIEFVSAGTHIDSEVEQLKERCRSVSAVLLLEKVDVSDVFSAQSVGGRLGAEEVLEMDPSLSVNRTDNNNSNPDPLYITSSSSAPSLSAPLSSVGPDPAQALIDHLKAECMSSRLTVALLPLDHNVLLGFRKRAVESSLPPEAKHGHSGNPESSKSGTDPSSGSEGRKVGVVRRLSASFKVRVSPAPAVASGKAPMQVLQKEHTGAGTGRKACVSGLSVSRWSKKDAGEGNGRQRRNAGRTRTKTGDCSLNHLLPTTMNQTGEPLYDWWPGNSGIRLPGTPMGVDQLSLSVLANFTPDTLTTHNWGRLKAALSIHKKKTAFPTPRRLALSNLKSPGGMDISLDLFGSPMVSRTPLSKIASSRLLCLSTTNSSIGPDEDISDAEKVYQECQQDGPLSFEDCIPPAQMKCCSKIGEGTFGEVFSTINNSGQTVALKIIPVEGSEKVNGEAQKSFGEILHEIIISKELSSLGSKENNKTCGFIGLNNLHCVQGSYPSALLKAWDKFDREKTSENDRPDFFGKEQIFVILEFEFGGSDLENMNGKLSSIAQAKSLLHQVTAALAVAEQALCFEHRDLHWGNILVKTTKQKQTDFILNGSKHSVETRGVHVNIIDYSLSRLEIDGLTVSCDISSDEELFMGQGDYQFEIYRLMKKENNNCWGEYNPHSNVLWLHYLVNKLLTMKYKTKAQSSQQKTLKSNLKSFQSEILRYRSATDALQHCSLFQ